MGRVACAPESVGMHPGDMEFAVREMAVACERGNVNRVKQLLAWGVEPNVPLGGDTDDTLLARAARFGQYMVVKRLLKAGADPSMRALIDAISSGSRHAVEYIADEMHFRGQNVAAYPWLTVLGKREFLEQLTPEMALWLVNNGIDLEETDSFGRSINDLAEKYAHPEVAKILLDPPM